MSTHNQCFRAKIRKNVYPGKPQFYYVKVGCKGVFVTRTCFHVYKTAFCGQILCDSKEFWWKVSLIIGVSNDTKRKEIKKPIIGISKF